MQVSGTGHNEGPHLQYSPIQQSFFRLIESKSRSGSAKHAVEHWETSKFTAASLPSPPDDKKPKRGRPTVNLRDQPCKLWMSVIVFGGAKTILSGKQSLLLKLQPLVTM